MKPVHTHWMIELYSHMTTGEGKKNIESRWRAAVIQDAVKLGLKDLPTVDRFRECLHMKFHPKMKLVWG